MVVGVSEAPYPTDLIGVVDGDCLIELLVVDVPVSAPQSLVQRI
jgi:hypothetical protein